MSIKIGNVKKQRKNLHKQITVMVGFNIDFKNTINNINTTLLRVFLFIKDVEELCIIIISHLISLTLSPSLSLSLEFEQILLPNVVSKCYAELIHL